MHNPTAPAAGPLPKGAAALAVVVLVASTALAVAPAPARVPRAPTPPAAETAPPPTTAPPTTAPPTTAPPDPCASYCLRVVRGAGEIPALFERDGEWVVPFVLTAGEEVCARPAERPPELARALPGREPVWSVRAGDVDVIVQAELSDRSPPTPC